MRNETGTTPPRQELITGRRQFDFLMCRSNQLIRIIRRPARPSRPVVSVWLPGSLVPLGFSCLGLFPALSLTPSGSSRSLVVLSSRSLIALYHHPVMARPIHGGGSKQRGRWRGGFFFFFFSCAVFVSSLSFAHLIGFSSSGASDRPVPRRGGFVVSSPSSHPAHLTRPHCPRVHHGGGGVCHLSSKQRHHGGLSPRLIISSHHGDDRRRWRGASRPGVSSYASRSSSRLIPGHQRGGSGGGGRSKQENTKEREKTGRETGRKTERERQDNEERSRNENGRTE